MYSNLHKYLASGLVSLPLLAFIELTIDALKMLLGERQCAVL